MAGIRFAEGLHVVPVFAPATTTADGESAFVKLKNMQWLSWLVSFGSSSGGSTQSVNIAVKSTTSSAGTTNTNDYALPFKYRLATLGADSWGTITSVTTATGYVAYTGDLGNANYLIEVDPDSIYAHDSDATEAYIDLDYTGDGATDVLIASVIFIGEPRFPQNANLSSS